VDARRIKALREELGLSVSQLARELSVDVKTILSWEAGRTFPTKKHADKLEGLATADTDSEDRVSEARPVADSAIAERGTGEQGQVRGDDLEDAVLDHDTWRVVQKLLLYPDLLRSVQDLCASYPDPPPPRRRR